MITAGGNRGLGKIRPTSGTADVASWPAADPVPSSGPESEGGITPMAFWDQLKQRSQDMSDQLKTKTDQFKNKDFAAGSMAMCALIAAADGTIDADEKRKVAAFITSNDVLSIFPASELQEKFNFYSSKLQSDFDFGKVEAIQTVAKLKKKPDQARAVIQVGIIIGGADGHLDTDEKRVVKEACQAVGIDPSEFDL
jgi:tellurite resistance protein TerB